MRKDTKVLLLVFFLSMVIQRSEGQVVIGILTLPSFFSKYPFQQYSSIVRAYVQYLQDTNEAITVPIHWDSTEEELDDILSQVNGVFLTGGPVQFMEENSIEQKYLETVTYIVEKTKEFNDDDDYFPLWGTCLGFQVLNYIAAGNDISIMKRKLGDTDNHSVYGIDEDSKLFSDMPSEYIEWLQNSKPAFYSHDDAIIKEWADENDEISDNVTFTSFSKSNDGVEYVASMEYDDYPIYAVQFHPEKNLFEPKAPAQRDELSLDVNSYFRDFFIEECKKNEHSFEDESDLNEIRIDRIQWVELESSHHSSFYFIKNLQNSDVNYEDRYGFRKLVQKIHKKKRQSNKKQHSQSLNKKTKQHLKRQH